MNAIRTVCCFVLAACLVVTPACVTQQQVQQIVTESNLAIQASAVMAEADPFLQSIDGQSQDNPETQKQLKTVIDKIDAFLEQHGDQKVTANAMILRKAVVLLVAGKPNMATATFTAYDPTLPGNTRDLGIYKSHEVLTWWSRVAPSLDSSNVASFESKTAKLTDVINSLPRGSGIRYYLATLRSQIYLKWATLELDRRPRLLEGLRLYCNEFDKQAQDNVKAWIKGKPEDVQGLISSESLRWYGHVEIIYHEYTNTYQQFLDEIHRGFSEDPDNVPRELRGITERVPSWPEECGWMIDLLKTPIDSQ